MSTPRLVEFAAAVLIGTCGRLLFQQRDSAPNIRNPGGIGLFGGHREPGESFAACIRREVHEELGVLLPPERFEPLSPYAAIAADGHHIRGEHFLARNIPVAALQVTEGSLLLFEPRDLPALLPRLVPSSAAAAHRYLKLLSAAH
jgi:8-oxo-dGTP pyrophosphatase MutT (NUDIX family)